MPSRADASTDATGESTSIATLLQRALSRLCGLFVVAPGAVERRGWELPIVCALALAGAILRFAGLGSVGLHGDEETMAMPVMHIVEHGDPRFPSGMFYGRAIGQLYLMAGSVVAFGESEWALRLPSALCGVLLIFLAWPLGRRFLSPAWNMAFVAAVSFLPGLIEVSQTARMYIFLHAALAAFAILVFRWERTDRLSDLALAVFMLLVAVQFQTIAVFAALLLLFPGLANGDLRKTTLGVAALAAGVAGFAAIDAWTGQFYPDAVGFDSGDGSLFAVRSGVGTALSWGFWPVVIPAVTGAALALFTVKPIAARAPRLIAGALILLGLTLAAVLSWHMAVLMLVAGGIIARRSLPAVLSRLLVVAAWCLALALVQAFLLHQAGIAPVRKVIGAMTGLPSIWTFLQLATYSPIAGAVAAAGCLTALWRMSEGKAVDGVWIYFVLAVWVPLLVLGLFEWYVPPRYTDFALLPLLICALASAQALMRVALRARAPAGAPLATALAAGAAGLAVVNPVALAQSYDSGYASYPDHKGAAEFMLGQRLGPRDIIVAEDVLQQKYYLGRVDYWLLGKNVALQYCVNKNGEIRDFYTDAKLLGTGADLEALLQRPDRGAIYVIGSGEEQHDGRRYARSYGIFEMLQSSEFRVVYEGRDGLTRVWKVEGPKELARHTAATAASAGARR